MPANPVDERTLSALFRAAVARYVAEDAELLGWEPAAMGEQERGWSGAQIRRCRLALAGGLSIPVITKTMELKERRVGLLLSAQGHANVPWTLTLDLDAPGPVLACMQDVAANPGPPPVDLDTQVAEGLAAIHVRNLGIGATRPWLPRADHAYFADFLVPEVWRAHWAHALATNPAFAREFDRYTARLDAAAGRFIREMTALYGEGTSLTVTHGDLHPRDGNHVIVHAGRPYFIDWGWTYYGSFYLDLPAYFTPQTVGLYRVALAAQGLVIPEVDFMERYQAAVRYVGFKYLCAGIWRWPPGPTEATGQMLLHMLARAIDGAVPEARFDLSPAVWARLLAAHRAGDGR